MSEESAAGHDSEGKLSCWIAVMELIRLPRRCRRVYPPRCHKARADHPVQSERRVAEAADCTSVMLKRHDDREACRRPSFPADGLRTNQQPGAPSINHQLTHISTTTLSHDI